MGLYIKQGYAQNAVVRPTHSVDPRVKRTDPKYMLQWARYAYACAVNDARVQERSKLISRCRMYASGQQDTEQYKTRLLSSGMVDDNGKVTPVVDQNNRPIGTIGGNVSGWMNVDFDHIFSPLPGMRRKVIGKMESLEHDIFIRATDDASRNDREDKKNEMLAKADNQEFLKAYDESAGIPQLERDTVYPNTLEELEMFENMGAFTLGVEAALELIMNHTDDLSRYLDLRREIRGDLVDTNRAAVFPDVDPVSGKIVVKRVDPDDVYMDGSEKRNYEDSSFGFMIEYVTLIDLMEDAGLKEEDAKRIAGAYIDEIGNPSTLTGIGVYGEEQWHSFRIPVMRLFVRSVDSEFNTYRIAKDNSLVEAYEPWKQLPGGGMVPPKVGQFGNRVTERIDIQTIYTTRWIIDTEFVYGNGRMNDIPFDYSSRNVRFPIHYVCMPGRPLWDLAAPIADQIQLTYLKLQNDVAMAAPDGYSLEVGSVENMSVEGINTPYDVIALRNQTGVALWRRQEIGIPGETGLAPNFNPYSDLPGGYGNAIGNAINAFNLYYSQLAELTGLDRFSIGGKTPNQDQGKFVTEVAVAGTEDSITTIYGYWLSLRREWAQTVTLKAVSICTGNGPGRESYKGVIGAHLMDLLVKADTKAPLEMTITAKPRPSEEIKAEIRSAAAAALSGGKNGNPAITYSEYLFLIEKLSTDAGIQYARQFLAYKEAQRDKNDAEKAMMMQNAAKQQEMEREQLKIQGEIAVINGKKELAMVEAKVKMEADVEAYRQKMAIASQYGFPLPNPPEPGFSAAK